MKVQFDTIQIHNISANSGVFNGENSQNRWTTQCKENSGLGAVIGDGNILMNNINVIHDNDIVDMPVQNTTKKAEKGNES
ncbi:hypothetical protein [Alkalihalobacillus sp. AL-G]|uniref:hypothetical protein n=1 Tax=Alkalihalobacillus sp. AL-G TaxID=2926399 RepID=UPI002729F977|nr:hypothetical protein [Alkalihalobacillus sp. AL-G]WLD93298.1 hypothetical protein MOJ78_20265 [Alkalihalobacillus sp. AL-G]